LIENPFLKTALEKTFECRYVLPRAARYEAGLPRGVGQGWIERERAPQYQPLHGFFQVGLSFVR
jgi:hypothetical protein